MKPDRLLADVKEAPWWVIGLFLAALVGTSVLVNQVFFYYGTFAPVYEATGGLINGTLLASLITLLVTVIGVAFLLGKLRPPDVGLIGPLIPLAVLVTLLVWALLQAVELIAGLLSGGVAANPDWANEGVIPVVGALIGQALGNALVEEIEYRGFLLPQLYLKLNGLRNHRWGRIVVAVLLMAIIFALLHIPNRIAFDQGLGDLPLLAALGVLFALVYLRTGNLFLAVGLHTLHNTPTMLFARVVGYEIPLVVLELLLLIFWPRLEQVWERLAGARR